MANNTFQPTSFTVTSTFTQLATYLASAGFANIASNSVTSQNGYIRNNDVLLNLYVGFGTSAPSSYEIVGPKAALTFNPGMNVNEIWVASASSTLVVGFAEGSLAYVPPTVNGVIGEVTATENQVPKVDADGNLVSSSISDDGTAVTTTEPILASGTTTPYIETVSGKTNTGYVNIKGKTSGSLKLTAADATAQVVTVTTAVQTSGASTLTIPDQAGVSSSFVFTTLAQTLTNKTLTAPVINGATAASGNFDLSGSTGTFLTSTGANTLSGAVTVADATTPSVTLASGKTNTGFLLINGKTSGSTKIITADATAQAVVISTAAQTVGGSTLTIPDQAGASSSFVFTTLAQALTNKTAVMKAGTNAVAPLVLTSGANLTVPVAGALEYDGVVFYGTPTAGARSLNVNRQFSIVPSGDFNLLTTSGVQSAFPTTGDVWSLDASTGYFFEGAYYITHTTTTCTVALAFACSSAPTSVAYNVLSVINAADGAPAAPVMTWVDTVATTVVTATSTVGWCIKFRGILRTNGATTVTPQVNWSANTTAPVMKVNSYVTFEALGTSTTNVLGNCA